MCFKNILPDSLGFSLVISLVFHLAISLGISSRILEVVSASAFLRNPSETHLETKVIISTMGLGIPVTFLDSYKNALETL